MSIRNPSARTQRLRPRGVFAGAARRGLTLIELILVISIIVVVAALTLPAVQRMIANQALQKGADRVRVAFGQARVQAIRTGEVQAMFYWPGGSYFEVAPLSNFQEVTAQASRRQDNVNRGTATDFDEDLLPRGVTFVAGETSSDSRSADVTSAADVNGQLEMVLFYPDGTSQDAKLTVRNTKGSLMGVELRGLTGTARTRRVDNATGGSQ